MPTCSLCNADVGSYGMIRHEEWHTNCKKNKRNTVEGVVKWI